MERLFPRWIARQAMSNVKKEHRMFAAIQENGMRERTAHLDAAAMSVQKKQNRQASARQRIKNVPKANPTSVAVTKTGVLAAHVNMAAAAMSVHEKVIKHLNARLMTENARIINPTSAEVMDAGAQVALANLAAKAMSVRKMKARQANVCQAIENVCQAALIFAAATKNGMAEQSVKTGAVALSAHRISPANAFLMRTSVKMGISITALPIRLGSNSCIVTRNVTVFSAKSVRMSVIPA